MSRGYKERQRQHFRAWLALVIAGGFVAGIVVLFMIGMSQ